MSQTQVPGHAPATDEEAEHEATVTRLLQRQVMPLDADLDVLALYVDAAASLSEFGGTEDGKDDQVQRAVTGSAATVHPDQLESRTAFRIRGGDQVSFASYFNAFPASYWRRWTIVKEVTLTLTVSGPGATVIVYKSTANGRVQRVDSAETHDRDSATFVFDLTLKPFVDGGWYWYNVIAGDADVVVESAEWTAEVPEERGQHGTVDIAITTMNRPDFCAKLLGQLGADADLRPYLDEVLVMEQGTKKVIDSPDFAKAESLLGDTLRVLEQGNLGGSGGYARGQLESVRKGSATYAMMMDDDVVCEPEGIIRAVTFGDLCKRPTLVGGHMFSLYARSRLHSFGEVVQPWRFWWQSAAGVQNDWDFAARNLRSAAWLHRRVDVDYNGWFMCLIPRTVLEEIGLSLPVFIKWDDSEYGLRASAAGYPTVTLPGSAVWHVPWTDKNDALDWQSYFHQRNRFVAALLHSQYPRGGRMVQESLNHQIKHLVSMQYSTVAIRHQALLDVLDGPGRLHESLPTKLSDVRAMVKRYADAQLEADRDAFPPVRRTKPPKKGRDGAEIKGRFGATKAAIAAPLRQFRKPRALSQSFPEAEIAAMDAQWHRLTRYDSAVVSMNDGTSAAFYHRDPAVFRELLTKTLEIHQRLLREWPRLAQEYRAGLDEITAPKTWEKTFEPWLGND